MLKGSLVALVTPFHEDGSVNYEKLGELLDLHCGNSDGIVILGTGSLNKKLTVKAVRFTKSAAEKIEAAGGKVEVI